MIIALFLPVFCHAQDTWMGNDKLQHFTTSTTLSFAGGQILESVTGWKYSDEYALVGVVGLGMVKELTIDKSPSYRDLTFNIFGAVTGYYVNRAINKKLKTWRK